MAQLITGSGGYAATVGGTVRVIGSNDVDVISLADIAGKISFDGSFNRGGDFIVLPNAAKTYSIVRASSSITLSDADSSITIPVGSKGTTLQFSDGELVLKFDGQIMIGSQIVTTASAAITTTPSSKTALPAATSASGTLLMAADEPVTVGGNVRVVGTNGSDTVTVADVAGNISFDGSFNRGGDKIVVGKFAENYSAARPNASNVTIADSDTKLTIPMGSKGSSIQFSNESRTLVYSDGNAYLGNQTISSQLKIISSYSSNIKFTYLENAFKGTLPFDRTATTCFSVIDVNSDGYKDIVFAFWTGQTSENWGKNVGDTPTPDKISIFINHGGLFFADETPKYIAGATSLGGASRKVEATDINHDGKTDLVFAVNREDGRSGDPWAHNTSYLSALVSEGQRYQIYKFGAKDWYHSSGFGTINGADFFAGAGFTGGSNEQGGFTFADGSFKETIDFPFSLSPNTFMFFNPDGGAETTALIQTQAFPNLLGIEGWVYKGNNWISAGKIDNIFEFVKNVKFFTYNGDDAGNVPVFKMGSSYIIGGGGFSITESSKIDILNNGKYSVVMKMETPIISGFDPNLTNTVRQNDDIINENRLVFATINNGKIEKLDIQIKGFLSNTNFNYMNVFDVNKDGFDDIITCPYSKTGIPVIYLNDKVGGFYISDIIFDPTFRYHNQVANAIFEDFNNDGIFDIITMPGNGNDISKGLSMEDFRYYVGSNSISMG